MTTQPARGASLAPAVPAEEAGIAEYLEKHPEFFERNLAVLAKLRLPHLRGGTTISLVERQVEVLRERQAASEERLQEFIRVARANDALADKIQRLSRRLLSARSLQATIAAIEASLREDFDASNSRLVLPGFDASGVEGVPDRFLRAVPKEEPALKSFETLFGGGKPRCGQVRDIQRDFLFGDEAATIGSVALVPLGEKGALGLLAVGSADTNRFHPGMSTEFLARMGELIADSIQRHL
ncbi:MAG: DUF484 family protein [Steroidobacteraceae bacterium]|jgi:hypothetical protein|nr:DUF484 family protein [Steroidobacteraceae bacterium]